jgi:hypothetical protein
LMTRAKIIFVVTALAAAAGTLAAGMFDGP